MSQTDAWYTKSAEQFAKDAAQSAEDARGHATDAANNAKDALDSAELARQYSDGASGTVAEARQYSIAAANSAQQAESYENAAATHVTDAQTAAVNASSQASNAQASADNAKISEDNSKTSELEAKKAEQSAWTAAATAQSGPMTKAEFDALREKRKSDNAGSGFLEWGKYVDESGSGRTPINEGVYTELTRANTLYIGARAYKTQAGISRTDEPVVLVDGAELHVVQTATGADVLMNFIGLPPAPDGTKTYDSATGVAVQHPDVDTAFASETATNKVIVSRQDLVFLEVWHEEIDEKGVVYPLGNVQYGSVSWEGIGLSNSLVAQAYSAFGEWDGVTKGYGVTWSTLSDVNKLKFIQDPSNNIYRDGDKLIQVRYRIRVVEGLGNDWGDLLTKIQPRYSEQGSSFVLCRGKSTDVEDFGTSGSSYYNTGGTTAGTVIDGQRVNTFVQNATKKNAYAYRDLCYFLPIALVQRLNQGAYHPVWNEGGCRQWNYTDQGHSADWFAVGVGKPTSVGQCFYNATTGWEQGKIGYRTDTGHIGGNGHTGRSDQYEFYDAIYAGQVKDLRLSARVQDTNKLLEDSIRKAVAGEMRGWGKVPFTKGGVETELTASFDSLPMVNILGQPVDIGSVFPDGVVGKVITGTELSHKCVSNSVVIVTGDGTTWSSQTVNVNQVTNSIVHSVPAGRASLVFFEALSHFTEGGNNSVVVGNVGDAFVSSRHETDKGNRVHSSVLETIGKDTSNTECYLTGLRNNASLLKHYEDGYAAPTNNSDKVVAQSSLTAKDGLLYLQLRGVQGKYDAAWDSSNELNYINGEGTKTDTNGNTVKTFCHHSLIPLGINSYSDSAQATEV